MAIILRTLCWASIFITGLRFPPDTSISSEVFGFRIIVKMMFEQVLTRIWVDLTRHLGIHGRIKYGGNANCSSVLSRD